MEAETGRNASARGFLDEKAPNCYRILMLGEGKSRVWKYVPKEKVPKLSSPCLNKYKVFIAEAYGCGALGETSSTPVLSTPGDICTETFLEIGPFNSELEAASLIKYIKTKFFRCLVSILKTTQHTTQKVYRFVPKQDFTANSDIDWTKSIEEIDEQLFKKYGLDEEEIAFIKENIEPME